MSDYGFWAGTSEEVDLDTLETMYGEALDDSQEWYVIGDLEFSPWVILRELDPIAWRESINNYHDSLVEDGQIVEELEDEED